MRRLVALVSLSALLAAPAFAAGEPPMRFTGTVTAKTVQTLVSVVTDREGETVGLDLVLDPSAADTLIRDGGTLSITADDRDGQAIELHFQKDPSAGGTKLSGWFEVEAAGMGQGILAYGLAPVAAPKTSGTADIGTLH